MIIRVDANAAFSANYSDVSYLIDEEKAQAVETVLSIYVTDKFMTDFVEGLVGICQKYDEDAIVEFPGDVDYSLQPSYDPFGKVKLSNVKIQVQPLNASLRYKLRQDLYTYFDIMDVWFVKDQNFGKGIIGDVDGTIIWSDISVQFDDVIKESIESKIETPNDLEALQDGMIWDTLEELLNTIPARYDLEDWCDEYIVLRDNNYEYVLWLQPYPDNASNSYMIERIDANDLFTFAEEG